MSLRHHPSTEILTAYASGTLEPGFGLVAAAHVEVCAECRARISAFEATSGAALKSLPEAKVGADALTKVMSRLETQDSTSQTHDTRPLLDRLSLKPKKWIAPGVWVAAVNTPHARDNRVYLLSVAPGMPAARHGHSGAEFCTVLNGAFRDQVGLFEAGDFAAAYDDLEHLPVVEGDEACLCLFATEGRLKAQGVLGRLAFAYADV